MKNKISKILGVGLTIAVLTSLLVAGAPASAGTLEWTTESLPSGITYVINAATIADYAISADGQTIYAVTGTNHVYKSTSGGSSWSRKTMNVAPGATFELVAVAPDSADIVAVGDSNNGTAPSIYISTTGASSGEVDSWNNTGTIGTLGAAAGTFNDLVISPAVSGVREVVAVGVSGTPRPAVYALNLGGTVASWTDVSAFTGMVDYNATTTVYAAAFSPNYVSDRVLTAVTSDTADGDVLLQIGRFTTAITGSWNAIAGFTDYTGVDTDHALITTDPAAGIVTATLSLAPTYTGLDSASRYAFVAINSGAALGSGIFRMNDVTSKRISDAMQFSSAAYNGTNLVAGKTVDNVVYRSADPLSTTPTFTPCTQGQRPSGGVLVAGAWPTITKVAWAGTNVVASTTGAESAFSRSEDNGANFNDVSMVNTATTNIADIAVAPDGSKWYMAANDGTDTSVWSKTGTTWVRLMTIIGSAGTYSIRIAPENKQVVYLVQIGTTTLYYSNDGGDKSWTNRIANEAITDMAVESADVIYYISGQKARKSTNAGFLWSDPATTVFSTATANTISSLGKDKVIIGGAATGSGYVAYSSNGGTTFTALATSVGGAGNILVTATTVASGDFIYAVGTAPTTADGARVQRWKIGASAPDDTWEMISGTITAANATTLVKYTGLILKSGVLYAMAIDAGADGVFTTADDASHLMRSLNPTEPDTSVVFSPMGITPDLNIENGRKSNLQLSTATTGSVLWGIDNDMAVSEESGDSSTSINDEVYSFTDTIAAAGPTLSGPADVGAIAVNPVSGNTYNIAFSWARPSEATDYQLQVAYDNKFTQPVIATQTFGTVTGTAGFDPSVSPVAWSVAGANFNPGTTYYWRARAIKPVYSPWSTARSFTVGSLDAPFGLASPAVGARDVPVKPIMTWAKYAGALWYELTVSEDPTFAIPEWSHNVYNLFYGVEEPLKNGTTYYWRVRGVTAEPYVKGTAVITPAGPWSTGAFTTVAEAVKAEPPVIVIEKPAPPAEVKIVEVPKTIIQEQPIPSWMLMTIIVIGAVLVIALIVLIVRTRRVA